MEFFSFLLRTIRNPDELIKLSGYPLLVLMLIIFAETGAMIFFLPGDSLLVTAGLYAVRGTSLNIWHLNLVLIPMAILGDATSYMIGKRLGPALFNKPRSRFFNPEHVRTAHAFYEKHGGKAIILARFMPILRTFVPVVAGVAQMTYRSFATYNVVGAAAWVVSMTLTGYFLGSLVPGIERHIEKIIALVLFLSILPGIIAWLRIRYGKKESGAAG